MRKKLSGFICVALLIATLVAPLAYFFNSSSTNDQEIIPTIQENATAPPLYHYEAKKETTIDDEGGYLDAWGNCLARSDGNSHYLVALDGSNVLSRPIDNVKYVRGDCAIVKTTDPAPHNKGIVSLTKGMLVKPEATLIEPASCKDGEPRFMLVAYATEKTQSEDDGFLSVSKTGYTSFYSPYLPKDDYATFDGYALVYDLEAQAFVDGVKIEHSDAHVDDLGNSFLVENIKAQPNSRNALYDPSGKELWSGDGSVYAGAHSFCFNDQASTYLSSIIDAIGTTRYTTESSLYPLNGSSDLYAVHTYSNGDQSIIDTEGTIVFECAKSRPLAEADGMYEIQGENYSDPIRILDTAGRPICEGSNLACVLPGYATINSGKMRFYDLYSLYSGGELLVSNLYGANAQKLVLDDGNQNDYNRWSPRYYYVFADHACTRKLAACDTLDIALVSAKPDDGEQKGVYDLFTGEAIIPARYDQITKAGDFIFAHANDTWDVYRVKRLGPNDSSKDQV